MTPVKTYTRKTKYGYLGGVTVYNRQEDIDFAAGEGLALKRKLYSISCGVIRICREHAQEDADAMLKDLSVGWGE